MRTAGFLMIALAFAITASAQATVSQAAIDAARRDAEMQQRQQALAAARLRAISEGQYSRNTTRSVNRGGTRLNPEMTDDDRRAIAIGEDVRKKYSDILKNGKSGVLRLQNADVCTPNKMIVSAEGGCPNNVAAKATAFSFRTGDYVTAMLADMVYKGPTLSSTGAYTIGIFAGLGQAELGSLDMQSDGIRQLAAFEPPADMAEFERQYGILRNGVRIGDFVYLPHASVNPGESFVLRSVAYRANIFRGEKPRRVNVLADDERGDVTIAFKVDSILSDGSVILVWRELKKSPPPPVVLEAATPKPASPNKFLSSRVP